MSIILFLAYVVVAGVAPCMDLGVSSCYHLDYGVVVSDRPIEPEPYEEAVVLAAERFQRYFGRPAPKALIMVTDHGGFPEFPRARVAECGSVLPWLTAEGMEAQRLGAIRQQIRQARPDIEEATLELLAKQALASAPKPARTPAQLTGALGHELCHLHLIEAFDLRRDANSRQSRYGGRAPDWLDEAAAVLCETDELIQSREELLWDLAASDQLEPLHHFLESEHPLIQSTQALRGSGQLQTGVTVLSGDAARQLLETADANNPAAFYAQSLGVARFLLDASGKPNVLGELAQSYADDVDFQSFLANRPDGCRLGRDLSALEAQWQSWLIAQGRDSSFSGL